MKILKIRQRHFVNKSKYISLYKSILPYFAIILYISSFLLFFHYFTVLRPQGSRGSLVAYRFPSLLISFSGPAFSTISQGDRSLTMDNERGIIFLTMKNKNEFVLDQRTGWNMEKEGAYYKRIDEPTTGASGMHEYAIAIKDEVYLFSTDFPGLYGDLDAMVQSVVFLEP